MADDNDIRRELTPATRKKLLGNRMASGLVVPLVIVLVGAGIIFGVTKMLSSGRTHRDLVKEMQSRTFGNRWVAAFELSKLVAGQGIPPSEVPWLVDNLSSLYRETVDGRTRNFIVLALGALKHPTALPLLELALESPDPNVAFNAVVAVGNLPEGMEVHWPKVAKLATSPDPGIRHAAVLTLAAKRVDGAQQIIGARLQDESIAVRYAAALALVQYRSEDAVATVREILQRESHEQFDSAKWQKLRLGLISAIGRQRWREFSQDLEKVVQQTNDLRIETTAKEALNLLKI